MRRLEWLALLAACGQPQDAPRQHATHTLDKLTGAAGWTADYDATGDRWSFVSATGTVHVERAPAGAVASPDAFVHAVTKGTIETRQSINDGFALTVLGPSGDRQAHAVRHVGTEWLRCAGDVLPDVVAVCASLKLRADARSR